MKWLVMSLQVIILEFSVLAVNDMWLVISEFTNYNLLTCSWGQWYVTCNMFASYNLRLFCPWSQWYVTSN